MICVFFVFNAVSYHFLVLGKLLKKKKKWFCSASEEVTNDLVKSFLRDMILTEENLVLGRWPFNQHLKTLPKRKVQNSTLDFNSTQNKMFGCCFWKEWCIIIMKAICPLLWMKTAALIAYVYIKGHFSTLEYNWCGNKAHAMQWAYFFRDTL